MTGNKDSIKRQLGRGMIIVLVANVINMIFNVLLNFIQPKYLSVDSYSEIKTFALYLSATGVFHLGYEDGTYLKYGGKKIHDLDKNEVGVNISTLRIFQFVVMILVLLFGIAIHDDVLMIFAFLLLPYNMTMHFRLFYQATGNFNLYGRIMNFSTGILFLGNVFLIFIVKKEEYYWYLWLQVLIFLVIWIALEISFSKTLQIKFRVFWFSTKELTYGMDFS